MSDLRYDPLRRAWVIIAAQRGRRPVDTVSAGSDRVMEDPLRGVSPCPFCPGNEAMTPPEIMSVREQGTDPDSPGWSVRVIPNKYPALTPEAPFTPKDFGPYAAGSGFGVHEVVIETPDDNLEIEDLSIEDLSGLFRVYGQRLKELNGDGRFRAVLIYKNRGAEAGATLGHAHSQIIAMPVMPALMDEELSNCREQFLENGQCLMCTIVSVEIKDKARIVAENDRYLAFAPFPSRTPFEIFIVPRGHLHDFSMVEDAHLSPLAEVFRETLRRLNTALGHPPYNLIFHSSPPPTENKGDSPADPVESYYHWYLQLIPKTTKMAGFEWGTGFSINPTPPEEAAQTLRNIKL